MTSRDEKSFTDVMRVRGKLILSLTVVVCIAIVPISLYLIETLATSSIEKARQVGKVQSEFFAKSIFNLLLTNGGNIKATRVDARETIKIFESLQGQGLRMLEALFLSKDSPRNGSVLVSWPHKGQDKKKVPEYLQDYTLDDCSLALIERCMVFTAATGLEGQPPSVAVRMEFSEATILEPVTKLRNSLLLAMLLAFLIVLVLGIVMNLQIINPLRLLQAATQQIASGNLNHRIEINRKDEFGDLARSFNAMSESLKKYIAELDEKYRELNAARSIQLALLPESLPKHASLEFAARFLPMAEVGGDIYDVFPTENGFAVIVADVSGHGVPAALITGMAKMVIAGRPDLFQAPSEMLHHLNHSLLRHIGNRFLTLVYAFLDLSKNKLFFANGGHPDILVVNRTERTLKSYNVRGTMVGVFPDQFYEQHEIDLHPGDRLIFLTDGILECSSPEEHMYEDVRLEKFLLEHVAQNAAVVCDLLMQDIQRFRGESLGLTDDATVVVVDINF